MGQLELSYREFIPYRSAWARFARYVHTFHRQFFNYSTRTQIYIRISIWYYLEVSTYRCERKIENKRRNLSFIIFLPPSTIAMRVRINKRIRLSISRGIMNDLGRDSPLSPVSTKLCRSLSFAALGGIRDWLNFGASQPNIGQRWRDLGNIKVDFCSLF